MVSDDFLSFVLKRPVGRVESKAGAAGPARRSAPPGALLFARVPSAEVGLLAEFLDEGFRVVDMGITFEAEAAPLRALAAAAVVRPAFPEDRQPVGDIARTSFQYSRFHLDPRLPRALADESRSAWTDNYFLKKYGDKMAVAEKEGRAAGFLLGVGPRAGLAQISLIGVREAARGLGLGKAMIGWLAGEAGVERIEVGTQAANIAAARFYEAIGFRIRRTDYVCHLHLADD